LLFLTLRQIGRSWLRKRLRVGVAVLTLSIGLATSTALFSIVDALTFRPLPFPKPRQLVILRLQTQRAGHTFEEGLSKANLRALEYHRWPFAKLAAIGERAFADAPVHNHTSISGRQVSWQFFETLNTPPLLGRSFGRDDEVMSPVVPVILGYGIWQSVFAGDTAILGRSVHLAGTAVEVVGIMPKGFDFPWGTDVWTTLNISPQYDRNRHLLVVGRLLDGVSTHTAADAVNRMILTGGDIDIGISAERSVVRPLREFLVPQESVALLLLWSAAIAILLLAWVQTTGFLVRQFSDSYRDVAVHIALGASPRSVLGFLSVEVACLAGCALVIAWLALPAFLQGMLALLPEDVTRGYGISLDTRSFGFSAAASLAGALVAASGSAVKLFRRDPARALLGNFVSRSGNDLRLRRVLVVLQLALSCALAVIAALLMGSYLSTLHVDLGFRADGLFVVTPPSGVIRTISQGPPSMAEEVLAGLQAISGVERAAGTNVEPLSPGGFLVPVKTRNGQQLLHLYWVTPAYFQTTGSSILSGREFQRGDDEAGPPVAIVNENAALLLFGDRNAVGEALRVGSDERQIVGVVKNTRDERPDLPARPQLYIPSRQFRPPPLFVVRSSLDLKAASAAIQNVFGMLSRDADRARIVSVDGIVDHTLAPRRSRAVLLGLLSLVAVILTGVAMYGATMDTVRDRWRDSAIRLAVGAPPGRIALQLTREAALLTAVGISVGLGLGWIASRLLGQFLFGVTFWNPFVLATALIISCLVSIASAHLASRTVTSLDPNIILKSE
jgi:putative ABC transport system permease protein